MINLDIQNKGSYSVQCSYGPHDGSDDPVSMITGLSLEIPLNVSLARNRMVEICLDAHKQFDEDKRIDRDLLDL